MSSRSAKLLLEVSDWVALDRDGVGTMAIGTSLAGDVLCWAKGYREFLAHVAERREGEERAQRTKADAGAAMFDAQALARVAEMLRDELLTGDAKDAAETAMRVLGFPLDGGEL